MLFCTQGSLHVDLCAHCYEHLEKERREDKQGSHKADVSEVLSTKEYLTRGGANWGEGNPSRNLKEFENMSKTRGLGIESCSFLVFSKSLNSLYLTSHCFG